MVDGGIDMWGSRRVPPLQNMWMVEDTHPDEDMGETPLVPSEDARMTAPVPPEIPVEPEPEVEIKDLASEDPYGAFTKHVVHTIIRYRIYLDHDLQALFESAYLDFGHLERRRLQRITADINKQMRDRPKFEQFRREGGLDVGAGGAQDSGASLSSTQLRETQVDPYQEAYPESLNTEDPYEVFAYEMVEKIVRERLYSEEELLFLFDKEIASRQGTVLDYHKMLKVVANIKKELNLSAGVMSDSHSAAGTHNNSSAKKQRPASALTRGPRGYN